MRLVLPLVLIISSNFLFAQIKMEGMVQDSTGQALELANIIVVNQNSKAIETYTITDNQGFYKLNVNRNTPYIITISYIGMKTLQVPYSTEEVDIKRDFELIPDFNLDEVEVVQKIPIKIRGDTLIYDADSFKNDTDKKLGDVLKRLPGVEINDEGEIRVEGKRVNHIMIEGKKFFDGDTKLATKNIPAGVLDKIEVLKNYDNISMLKNIRDNQENVAINLKLKEGKKQFWFGDLSLGAGYEEKYIAHPNLFFYSPKYSINLISDFNNIGEAPLTINDLSRFSNSTSDINRDSGTLVNVANRTSGALNATYDKFFAATSKFGAANFNVSPKHDWDITGYAIYSKTSSEMLSDNFRRYVSSLDNQDPPNEEVTTNRTDQDKHFLLTKLSLSYKPDIKNQLDYDLLIDVSKQNALKDVYSSVLGNIKESEIIKNESFVQNLSYYHSPDERNVFAVGVQHAYYDNTPFYETVFSQNMIYPFSDDLGLDESQQNFDLVQNKHVLSNKFDAKIDYWYVVNERSNINLTLGTTLISQKFNSDLFQILDNGNSQNLDNANVNTGNKFNYGFNDYYLGLHYNLRSGIFVLSPGVISHLYNPAIMERFVRFLPDLNIKAQLKSTESINLKYGITNRFANAELLAEGLVLNTYNYLFRGNMDLDSPISHNIALRYTNSVNILNRTKALFINFNINYSRTIEALRNLIEPEGLLRISSPVNSIFSDHSFIANGSISKAFGKIVLRTNSSYLSTKFKQNLNDFVYENESQSSVYGLRLSSNFKKIPNFEVGYNLVKNTYVLGGDRLKFSRNSPYLDLKGKFLSEFTGNISYSYFDYRNQQARINSYGLLNVDISYQKKESSWEFTLQLYNGLNNRSINEDYTNNYYTNTSTYYIQPRYIMLNIKYNL